MMSNNQHKLNLIFANYTYAHLKSLDMHLHIYNHYSWLIFSHIKCWGSGMQFELSNLDGNLSRPHSNPHE